MSVAAKRQCKCRKFAISCTAAIFTRGGDEFRHTAIFIGGSDVSAGEAVLAQVRRTFFGPMRVSVMLDSNGGQYHCCRGGADAATHCPLAGADAMVLAATGPVGSRVVRLLALEGGAGEGRFA